MNRYITFTNILEMTPTSHRTNCGFQFQTLTRLRESFDLCIVYEYMRNRHIRLRNKDSVRINFILDPFST